MKTPVAPGTRTPTFKTLVCSESPIPDALTASRSGEVSYLRCIIGQREEKEKRAESGERSAGALLPKGK